MEKTVKSNMEKIDFRVQYRYTCVPAGDPLNPQTGLSPGRTNSEPKDLALVRHPPPLFPPFFPTII